MAAQKSQGLVIGLVIFVVLFLCMLVSTILLGQQYSKLSTQLQTAQSEKNSAEAAQRAAVDNVLALAEVIGYPEFDITAVGNRNDQNDGGANTLFAKIDGDMDSFADESNRTYKDALAKMRGEVDAIQKVEADRTADFTQLKQQFETSAQNAEAKVNEHKQAAEKSNQDLQTLTAEMDRQSTEQINEINAASTRANKAVEQTNQVKRNLESERSTASRTIHDLTLELQAYKLTEGQTQSVGDPSGTVVSVYYTQSQRKKKGVLAKAYEVRAPEGYVHIDRGSAHGLRLQTRFSVWDSEELASAYWSQKNMEIKKEAEDAGESSGASITAHPQYGPKGNVEVVQILGPKQALCRITMSQNTRPILAGDKIYSPLFNRGQTMHVALVGSFDMTGRGTNDRELLKHIITSRGGEIDVEVNDEGQVTGEITPKTMWLVMGTGTSEDENLSDEDDEDDLPQESEFAKRIKEEATTLQAEAKRLGVQIIDQEKFYSFLGYSRQSPIYNVADHPGGQHPSKRFRTEYSDVPERQPVRLKAN